MDTLDRKLMNLLQEGLPLAKNPYAVVAAQLGVTRQEIAARIEALLREGYIRRLGGAFDTRAMGYTSFLIGLRAPQDHHGPRPHDLRHRFAIRTLLHGYRCGDNVEQRLPELAAYLGHAHVSDTYWYLSATPELLTLAAQRLEPDRVREVQR